MPSGLDPWAGGSPGAKSGASGPRQGLMITHPLGASSSGTCLPVLVKQVGSFGPPVLLCLLLQVCLSSRLASTIFSSCSQFDATQTVRLRSNKKMAQSKSDVIDSLL